MRPPISIQGDIGRVVDDIYRLLTELSKAVNSPASRGGTATDTPGKEGDIRVVKGDAGQTHIEVKTPDGWARTKVDTFEPVTKGA